MLLKYKKLTLEKAQSWASCSAKIKESLGEKKQQQTKDVAYEQPQSE